jgi:hypothetical protein
VDGGERLDRYSPAPTSAAMRVPENAGLKLLRSTSGMPRSMSGTIVRGCRTLAP